MKEIYLTYRQLSELGCSGNLIRQWRFQERAEFLKIADVEYVRYMSIPESTRSKMDDQKAQWMYDHYFLGEDLYDGILLRMYQACKYDFTNYRSIYQEMGYSLEQATEYAKRHAVWVYFIETFYSKGTLHPIKDGSKAFNAIYPDKKCSSETFRHKVNLALKEGISRVVVRKKGSGRPKVFGDKYKYMVFRLASDAKAFSCADICRSVSSICMEMEMKAPKESTVGIMFREALRNTEVYASRYGTDKMRYDMLNYTSIRQAHHAGDQWQIDGWTMPFYYREDGRLKTMCLFTVMDAYSKKIVGYDVAKSENTETILKGIEDAVKKADGLPFEIVSDNHSFNQGKIAENFKNELDLMGVTWTVTSEPRHKQVIERSFRTFGDSYAKKQYGYTGQGIRSISPDSHISQELFDRYMKAGNLLTESQIKAIAVHCVDMWNKGTESKTASPDQMYSTSEAPNFIKFEGWMNNPHFYNLFTRNMSEVTVRNGQINVVRSGHKYEYMLSSGKANQYNNKTLTVKYIDLEEGVYIYDSSTDSPIGFVPIKERANGALANRTDEDAAIFGKVSSVNKARREKGRAELLELHRSADERLISLLNQRTTPKNVIQEIRENVTQMAEMNRLGIDLQRTPDLPVFNESYDFERLAMEKEKKTAESPFSMKKLERINLSSLDE